MTHVRRLFVLLCGFEIIPQSTSRRDGSDRYLLSVPIPAFLLDTRQGWWLIDAGLDGARLRDPAVRAQFFEERGWNPPPVVWDSHDLRQQLLQVGVRPADVAHVVVTHLHADHTGHLKHLAHAPLHVQRREWTAAQQPGLGPAFIAEDYDRTELRWQFHEGDWQAMPGLRLLSTPGHTAGHQSAVVVVPSGRRYVLGGDVGDLMVNYQQEILPGETVDDAAALASLRRLNAVVAAEGAALFPGHDPEFYQHINFAPHPYH